MQAEFFTTQPVTIDIPIFQPFYALAVLGVVIFVVAWVLVRLPNWSSWIKNFIKDKWPRRSVLDDYDERKGNTLLAKRIGFCAVPIIVFFITITLYRLAVLLISPPDAPSLLGGGVDFRVHYLAFVGLATFLVALIGLPFALFRYEALERQTLAQEEGLITDRINKAVEGLGAEKTRKKSATNSEGESRSLEETLPNLEVRIGAIYALERIAQDSLRDHIQIMEILCAYIRQNAPASEAPDLPKPPEWFEGEDPLSDDTWKDQFVAWKREHRKALSNIKPRADVQTALTVIGRRSDRQKVREWGSKERYERFEKGPPEFEADQAGAPTQAWREAVGSWEALKPAYRLDLRDANLRKADMSGQSQKADFSHARFDRADLQGADFQFARIRAANFQFVQAQGADFSISQIQGAKFDYAQVHMAVFSLACAQWANFSDANAQGAHFLKVTAQYASFACANMENAHFRGARLHKTDFRNANAQGAGFNNANISHASFKGALLRKGRFVGAIAQGADFSDAQAQAAAFGRAEVQGAVFSNAKTQGAEFVDAFFDDKTNFRSTEFSSAALGSDISMLGLTQEQVNAAFGDGYTAHHLPAGLSKPDHWPDWDMELSRFYEEWRKWQREGDAYEPPPKPVE